MINRREDVDFILKKVMKGKPLAEAEKEFILEEFIEGEPLIIDDKMVFEIMKNDGKVIVLKPIGINILCKDQHDFEKQITIRRYIENGKIVQTTL